MARDIKFFPSFPYPYGAFATPSFVTQKDLFKFSDDVFFSDVFYHFEVEPLILCPTLLKNFAGAHFKLQEEDNIYE